jgi:hypothetical protein
MRKSEQAQTAQAFGSGYLVAGKYLRSSIPLWAHVAFSRFITG